jgi:hypothetical protein
MTAFPILPDPVCDFCDKRGLPVLLVRQAVAAPGGGAPPWAPPFASSDTGSEAPYTARLLRSGYVYVFDEARHRWEGYYVTAQAYLMKFSVDQPMHAAYARCLEPCERSGHREIAGCVTVRGPRHAGVVWFGFSDVEWTPAVLEKHADPAWRARHMQKLDVAQWLASQQAPHAVAINDVAQHVAEYHDGVAAKAFGAGPFAWANRRGDASRLIDKADACLRGKGLVLAVPDPVGIVQELGTQMQAALQSFVDDTRTDKLRARKLAASAAIGQLESAVRHQAQTDEMAAARQMKSQAMAEAGASLVFPGVRERIESIDNLTPADLERASNHAWDNYRDKFDERQRAEWQAQYDAQLDHYTRTVVNPLARSHTAWMNSAAFQAQMQCNMMPNDPLTGAIYTALTHGCVRGTAGIEVCFKHYVSALDSDDPDNPKNIILRALVFNHDGVAEAAKNATEIDRRIVPWDDVYGPYRSAVERMHEGSATEAARLMHELAGPIAKVASKAIDGPAKLVIGIMSLHAGKRWVKVALHGSRKAFRTLLVREVLNAHGDPLNEQLLRKAVDREIKLQQIRGDKLEGQRGAHWIVLLDAEQLRGLPAGTPESQLAWLRGALRTPQQLQEMRFNNFSHIVNTHVRMGVVSAILQMVCLSLLIEDEANAMAADKTEARWRLRAQGLAIAATVCEITGAAVDRLPVFSAALARGTGGLATAATFLKIGRRLGALGGIIMAFWDLKKAWQESQRGKGLVASLYLGSAVLGLTLSIGFLLALNPFLLASLVISLVTVTWALEKVKDNKLQSWLEQCIFGRAPNYPDSQLEMAEFKLALK